MSFWKLFFSLLKLLILLIQRELTQARHFQRELTYADTFKIGWIDLNSEWTDLKNSNVN